MIDLSHYRERLSPKAREIIEQSIEESRKKQHYYLGVEHIFLAFTQVEANLFEEVMDGLGIDPREVLAALQDKLNISRQYTGQGMRVPTSTRSLFQSAWERVQNSGRQVIRSTDILVAIFLEGHCLPVQILKNMGIDPSLALERVIIEVKRREEFDRESQKRFELPPYLKQFGVNLNRLVALDQVPPIIGRDDEIDRMIEFLCHRDRPNSVIVLGEPGVGKTALVMGLARKLELDPESVPPRLRNSQVVEFQMNAIVAGTMFRGMFEERIERVVREVKERGNIILFIDEAHSLVGAGSAIGVPADAANILKATLARGEIQVIGATTPSEYKQFILEDEALSRRFRPIWLSEPSLEETREIIYGIHRRLEQNYTVHIREEAIETALELSKRYNRAVRLPEKVIGWLDTAAVRAEIRKPDREVGRDDIVSVISEESRIPVDMVFRDTGKRFARLEEGLGRRVVGQEEAVRALATRIRLNKGPLKENYCRPDGVLLFLGPTGVGKTELARALAELLFGDEQKMIRLDMSENRDGIIAMEKLIGMPRGIVGSERGGILTNQVRESPYSVVLLDEVEKSGPEVLNLFLQVFDEGFLTDGRGKKVYFSDTVIIMTSNLGSGEFQRLQKPMGFLKDSADLSQARKTVMEIAENRFSLEFLNRIDDIIVFSPLTEEEVGKITRMYLSAVRKQLVEQGKNLQFSPAVVKALARAGYSPKFGARFLKRRIDELVKIPITEHWHAGENFMLGVGNEGEIRIKCDGIELPVSPEGRAGRGVH